MNMKTYRVPTLRIHDSRFGIIPGKNGGNVCDAGRIQRVRRVRIQNELYNTTTPVYYNPNVHTVDSTPRFLRVVYCHKHAHNNLRIHRKSDSSSHRINPRYVLYFCGNLQIVRNNIEQKAIIKMLQFHKLSHFKTQAGSIPQLAKANLYSRGIHKDTVQMTLTI